MPLCLQVFEKVNSHPPQPPREFGGALDACGRSGRASYSFPKNETRFAFEKENN